MALSNFRLVNYQPSNMDLDASQDDVSDVLAGDQQLFEQEWQQLFAPNII
jgi:hypothetical protein